MYFCLCILCIYLFMYILRSIFVLTSKVKNVPNNLHKWQNISRLDKKVTCTNPPVWGIVQLTPFVYLIECDPLITWPQFLKSSDGYNDKTHNNLSLKWIKTTAGYLLSTAPITPWGRGWAMRRKIVTELQLQAAKVAQKMAAFLLSSPCVGRGPP